ncbi:Zn-dependent hydrolase [Weissella sagaensis]|uniref:Zn-dependent hydrolase n=1 Tax=Weissella sagaensis TaxID=2559928 RepID=UPI00214A98DD|nr:Zn-dependent hydrolase [Weissella sagaensis]
MSQLLDLLNQFTHQHDQNRLVYNQDWLSNQRALILLGQRNGATATVDDYGNVYLDFPGQMNDRPVATGSHMDTVKHGGHYDGLYGVLGGFCAIQQLYEQHGIPKHPLRLISFSEEEGSRFPAAFTGSKYYTGTLQAEKLLDNQGITFDAARHLAVTQLQNLPYVKTQRVSLPVTFTELHIEQGPRLAESHKKIGLVTGIVAQKRYEVTVHGQANHAGTTPMIQRQDAIATASALMAKLYALAAKAAEDLTFTIGEIHVSPNVSNVVAESCRFTIDCRANTDDQLTAFVTQMLQLLEQSKRTSVIETLCVSATRLSDDLRMQNAALATQMNYSYQTLFSGAGHDSQIMSSFVPTTMIFVPSEAGISHTPTEYTKSADLLMGVSLLANSLFVQANGE